MVWLGDDGHLYVAREAVEEAAQELEAGLKRSDFVAAMQAALRSTCRTVQAVTRRAEQCASAAAPAELRAIAAELGEAVSRVLRFGILSKFVPDRLRTALPAEAGTPFPAESMGLALARSLAALNDDCLSLGYPPQRLAAEWPRLPAGPLQLLLRFCADHAGYGPVAWDAPGYEDPRYTITALRAMTGAAKAAPARRPGPNPGAQSAKQADPLRRALGEWLKFLERENFYQRRAFNAGLVPVLRRLAPSLSKAGLTPEDLLFLDLRALVGTEPNLEQARSRREAYWANKGYLSHHGIEPGRLSAMLDGAGSR
jgi:hypothetical protein